MYQLSDKQIDFILNDISARGVEMESLQQNLLDHICCIIENNLEETGDFEKFYQKTIKTFYKDELWEIEEETMQLLIFKNYYTMKKIMIISGVASAAIMVSGILFKLMHWPGTGALLTVAILTASLIFLPLMFTLKAKENQNKKNTLITGLATLSGITIGLGVLFKIMHWPGANVLGLISVGVMLFLFIPAYFFSGIRNPEQKTNTSVSSILIIIGCGLFLSMANLRPGIKIQRCHEISAQNLENSFDLFSQQTNSISDSLIHYSAVGKEKIVELKQLCDKICSRIEALKLKIVNQTEGTTVNKITYSDLEKYDNYDIPTSILFGNDDKNAEPELLSIKEDLKTLTVLSLRNYNKDFISIVGLSDKKDVSNDLSISWEEANLYHTPLLFVLNNLTQLQLNTRLVEMSCLK